MYGILCHHYHPEDIDAPEMSEAVTHFISYNAGTRVLNTYPEVRARLLPTLVAAVVVVVVVLAHTQVVVLHDADIADPSTFLETVLRKEPFSLLVHPKHSAAMYVQRLGFLLVDEAFQLPLAHAHVFRDMM